MSENFPSHTEVLPETVESKLGHEFAGEMERHGIRTTVLDGEQNPLPDILTSLTVTDQSVIPDEPTVRLYRGVNPTDGAELAYQVGYLLKHPVYDDYGRPERVELEAPEVFQLVDAFTENPSYRGLMDAVESATMSDSDRRSVDGRIKDVRRNLVRYPDGSLMDELTAQHVAAPWGVPTQDLSPFVATSLYPDVAAGHGGKSLMVIDVPVSKVAGLGEGGDKGDEVLLAGTVKPEWITAVAEVKYDEHMSADTLQPLVSALGGIGAVNPAMLKDTELRQKSKENYQTDLEQANTDLIGELLATPDVDAEALTAVLESGGVTTYKEALWTAADYYMKQLQAAGRYARVSNVHELYARDELATQTNVQDGGVLNLDEIGRMAKVYNNALQRA